MDLSEDLLSVPDLDVWKYGETLRTMARTKQFEHLQFARSNDLLHINTSESMTEMTYMDNVSRYRSSLIEKFGQPDWDVSKEISKEGDTCLTYRGYIKFLMTDLEHVYPLGPARSKKEFKRSLEHIAKQMLCRGQAFAQAVRDKFPNHVRLSIHPSIEQSKIPISLLPTDTSFTTPWHCAVAFALDGSLTSGHRATFDADPNYKLVYDDQNMASHYVQKEVLSLLDWKASMPRLIAEPQYPCGWLIRPSGDAALSLSDIDSKKIRVLAEHNSPVILRGFTGTNDRESFIAKAHDLGKPVPWVYGLLLEVKDRGVDGRGMNNTLTAERMPFHYDGVFKTKTTPDGDVVPDPPRLQFFTAVSESTPGTGYTLFSASSRIWKHLPPGFSLEGLKQLKWSVKTTAWNSLKLSDLSLVEQHPTTGQPVLRYHEQWPRCKTAFDTSEVQIRDVEDATSKIICESLDGLLHDRRVCYWHCWERGDLLVSDNVAMLHTRTGFTGGSDRELWRIHID